jgi:hypothetical protein
LEIFWKNLILGLAFAVLDLIFGGFFEILFYLNFKYV